ncbi:MAG: hypothetical protein LBV43_05010 [Prevotella sp.]|nr:hypothetical protein [Prevotella sp.]
MKTKTVVLFFLFLFYITPVEIWSKDISKSYSTGLIFRNHEVNKDERTSVNLTPDKPLILPDGFSMEFDLKLKKVSSTSFGYVFRLISNDSVSLDMSSSIGKGRFNIVLNNLKGAKFNVEYTFSPDEYNNKWIKVQFHIGRDNIKYIIDGNEKQLDESFIHPKEWKIFFGANRHERYFTSDVPPMEIRNLKIFNSKGEVIRQWDMSVHDRTVVYDRIGGYPAAVSNGDWVLDKHAYWKEELSFITKSRSPQITYDSIKARFFCAMRDSLYILNIKDKRIEKIKYEKGVPFTDGVSNLIYDYKDDKLIAYKIDQQQLLKYDFGTREWEGDLIDRSMRLQHNNKFIHPETNELVVFGGYGYYTYSALLATHKLSDYNWEKENLIDKITPRYLATMGYEGGDNILILGGYGSTTGIQEESAHNLYDLSRINIKTKNVTPLGELENIPYPFVFGNSMIVNKPENKLYALSYRNDVYKSYINLLEVDMSNMKFRFLADSIPYNFQDTESYCDMFLYKNTYLYALVAHRTEAGDTNVKVYSLRYPPLAKSDVLESKVFDAETKVGWYLLWGGLFLILFGAGYFIYRKIDVGKKYLYNRKTSANVLADTTLPPLEMASMEKSKRRSLISLLGGFQIFGANGDDLTSHFTPVIRQMFLVILLDIYNTGKGVTSERLDETFWFDMDKSKATNNRNVNIRKLRVLLQEVGDIKLEKKGNYWQIDVGKDIRCDYGEITALLKEAKIKKVITEPIVEDIVALASSGILLPNIDAEWVERYKSDYSSLLIEVLLRYAAQDTVQNNLRLLVKLADVILIHDNIDEDSIKMKCRSLYKLGQKGLSKQSYDKFYSDYKNILNEPPNFKYEDIIASED